MKKILSILCVLMAIVGCKASSEPSKKVSKGVVSIEKSIGDYSQIISSSSLDVTYEQQPNSKPYLRIEVDEHLQEYVKVNVVNGVLKISLDKKNARVSTFRAYTNSTSLSKIKIGGSGNILLKNKIDTKSLTASVSGSGNMTAKNITSKDITISISGSGNATIGGKVTNANFSVSGSGSINALDLVSKSTHCSISGSGGARVYATDELVAEISGSGNVRYKGNPKNIERSVRGSGSISSL